MNGRKIQSNIYIMDSPSTNGEINGLKFPPEVLEKII